MSACSRIGSDLARHLECRIQGRRGKYFQVTFLRSHVDLFSQYLLSVELPMGKDHVPPDRLTLADT